MVFGTLADLVFDELRLDGLDRRVTLAVRERQTPRLNNFGLAITYFGSHNFLLPATLAVCGILHGAAAVSPRSSSRGRSPAASL
jgi:hypothetical protein